MYFGDHDDNAVYCPPGIEEVTFGQLLQPPFVTDGTWSFYQNSWSIAYRDVQKNANADTADKDAEVIAQLLAILQEQTFHGLEAPGNGMTYDEYVNRLLDADRLLQIQLIGKCEPGDQPKDRDLTLEYIRLIMPDETRCYLTAAYSIYSEIDSEEYVFYTDDSAFLEILTAFAKTNVNADQPS